MSLIQEGLERGNNRRLIETDIFELNFIGGIKKRIFFNCKSLGENPRLFGSNIV